MSRLAARVGSKQLSAQLVKPTLMPAGSEQMVSVTSEQVMPNKMLVTGEQAKTQVSTPTVKTGEQQVSAQLKTELNKSLLTSEQITGEQTNKRVGKYAKTTGEQAGAHLPKHQVSKPALTSEHTAKIIPINSRKHSSNKTQKPKKKKDLYDVLTSEQIAGEQEAKTLQTLLPKSGSGWWEVRPEGRGFTIKFRWRNPKQQTQTFPRISGEHFKKIKESGRDRARELIIDRITGYLEDCLFDPDKRDKARLAATRIGVDIGNDKNALAANY